MPSLARLALILPLAALPLFQGCIAVAHTDYSDYEEAYEVIALKYAAAQDVAVVLEGLQTRSKTVHGHYQPGSTLVIIPDQRTNSIVLKGKGLEVDQAVEVVHELDQKVE